MTDDSTCGDSVRAAVRAYHGAFEARDVDAIVAAFAPDGQVTASPGTFRGPEGLRVITQWAVDVSPTASVRDTGGTIVSGRTAIWEGEISERYDGIDYTYPIVEVFEFDEDLKIVRKHNYYDKLAILRQIATGLPGAKGMAYRLLLRVISAGDAEPAKRTT
jgi:ketosteroid isomerase-like protein